jgi:hypothetical protein
MIFSRGGCDNILNPFNEINRKIPPESRLRQLIPAGWPLRDSGNTHLPSRIPSSGHLWLPVQEQESFAAASS